MKWQIDFHRGTLKFLRENRISQSEIIEIIIKALKKFQGENSNIDIVKLKGKWFGFYRIKIGKLRIITEFNFDNKKAYIENIDWRSGVYKK